MTATCIRDENGKIVAYPVGYAEEELEAMFERHPGWYYSTESFGVKKGG